MTFQVIQYWSWTKLSLRLLTTPQCLKIVKTFLIATSKITILRFAFSYTILTYLSRSLAKWYVDPSFHPIKSGWKSSPSFNPYHLKDDSSKERNNIVFVEEGRIFLPKDAMMLVKVSPRPLWLLIGLVFMARSCFSVNFRLVERSKHSLNLGNTTCYIFCKFWCKNCSAKCSLQCKWEINLKQMVLQNARLCSVGNGFWWWTTTHWNGLEVLCKLKCLFIILDQDLKEKFSWNFHLKIWSLQLQTKMTYLINFRLFQVTSDIDLVTLKEPHVKRLFPFQLFSWANCRRNKGYPPMTPNPSHLKNWKTICFKPSSSCDKSPGFGPPLKLFIICSSGQQRRSGEAVCKFFFMYVLYVLDRGQRIGTYV